MLQSFKKKFLKIEHAPSSDLKFLYKNEFAPHSNLKADFYSKKLTERFNKKSQDVGMEYVVEFSKPCWIEPNSSYALSGNNKVIRESLPYNYLYPYPTYVETFSAKKKKKHTLKEAIYIHYGWKNYYHFHNDVLGQFYLLQKCNLDKSIPIVAPEWIKKFPFVSFYLKNLPLFSERKIIFMKTNEVYEFDRLIFAKNVTCERNQMNFVRKQLSAIETSQDTNSDGDNIFLYRKNAAQRRIKNFEEIAAVIKQKGFQLMDTAEMDLNDQISRFRNVKNLIAVHGAGIMNLLHGLHADMKLLEILPETRMGIHYYWLSNALSIQYTPILGSAEVNGEFEIDPKILLKAMNKLEF